MKKNHKILSISSIIIISGAIGFLASNFSYKHHLNDMNIDEHLLSIMTQKQYEKLSSFKNAEMTAKYVKGNRAYVVNGTQPNFISISSTVKRDELDKGLISAHTSFTGSIENVAPGSGMSFKSVDGELYAYSSGDVQDNPKKFDFLIDKISSQLDSLSAELE